jgi:hypothetical protein
MMDSSDFDRAHQRALNRAAQAKIPQPRSGQPEDQMTPWVGLKKVTFNYLPPSAAHQPMKYQPFDQ